MQNKISKIVITLDRNGDENLTVFLSKIFFPILFRFVSWTPWENMSPKKLNALELDG